MTADPIDPPGRGPTETQLSRLVAYVEHGSAKEAASALGISEHTLKNTLAQLYRRLDANSVIAALHELGWITLPSEQTSFRYLACGWTGHCGRPLGHRGQHGGFRP